MCMKSMSIRCRHESRWLTGICLVLIALLLLIELIGWLYGHRDLDWVDFLYRLPLLGLLFHTTFSGHSSLWVISEAANGFRFERDGVVLFEGGIAELEVIDEEKGVITLRRRGGVSFLFPRRRVFHEVLSQIALQQAREATAEGQRF